MPYRFIRTFDGLVGQSIPILLSALIGLTSCVVRPEEAPNIALQKFGPQSRFLTRPAEYTISVSNIGSAPATQVVVRDTLPSGMSYATSTPPGTYDPQTRTVSWNLGTLDVGAGTSLGVTLRGDMKGQQCNVATVSMARGPQRIARARACTLVAGLPELKLSIDDVVDPLDVGSTTTYSIDVLNQGTETAGNVSVVAFIPSGLAYVSSSGPTAGVLAGNTVTFAPLPSLLPSQRARYTVAARGVTPQDARFLVQLRADHLTDPLSVEESTRVAASPFSRRRPTYTQAVPAPAASGPTHIETQEQVSRFVRVENVVVRGRTVTGHVVNHLSRPIRDVHLVIRSIWLWHNEFNPGTDTLGQSVVYRVPGQVPVGGSLPFTYSPLPVSPRRDGHYETRVIVGEFTEVTY